MNAKPPQAQDIICSTVDIILIESVRGRPNASIMWRCWADPTSYVSSIFLLADVGYCSVHKSVSCWCDTFYSGNI